MTEERKLRLRRVLLGALAGAITSGLCPLLSPDWQMPCKAITLLVHAVVSP